MKRVGAVLSNLSFFRVFNLRDEYARGRCVMLTSAIISACISYMTSGVFYTSFLILNDIDIVNVGVISFLPLIANCFSVFAPLILERFKKRRVPLALARISYFAINILGITFLPFFVSDKGDKVFWFGVIVFVSNLINALFAGGYSIWHLNFIPDETRAEYFSYQQIISTAISSAVLLFSSVIADSLAGTPNQMTVLIVIRIAAFALALAEMVFLLLPKEYPYLSKVKKISVKNVFTLPFSNKKFLLTMLVMASWTFVTYLTASSLNYYLLDDVGIKYTFINTIDAAYALFLIFFSHWWKTILRKWSWLKTFAITVFMNFPLMMLYSTVSKSNYVWVMLVVRLSQHLIGVGMNLAYANFPFLNLPKEDQSNYLVFYTLLINLAGFLGLTFSTWFISATETLSFTILGISYTNVQLLVAVQGFGQLIIALYIYFNKDKIAPSPAR